MQTGKKLIVQARRLTKESGDITPGNQLLLDEKGSTYPGTLIIQQSGQVAKSQNKAKEL